MSVAPVINAMRGRRISKMVSLDLFYASILLINSTRSDRHHFPCPYLGIRPSSHRGVLIRLRSFDSPHPLWRLML